MRSGHPHGVLTCLCLLGLALPLLAQPKPAPDGVTRTAQGGKWSAPTTWQGGKLPAAGSKVLICDGHTVIYDSKTEHAIRSLHISGTLTFAPNQDTRLDVGLIRIAPGNQVIEEGFECAH